VRAAFSVVSPPSSHRGIVTKSDRVRQALLPLRGDGLAQRRCAHKDENEASVTNSMRHDVEQAEDIVSKSWD